MNVIMLNIPPRNYNPNPKGYFLGIKQKCRPFCYVFWSTEQKSYKLLLQGNNWLKIWIWIQLALTNRQNDILSLFIMVLLID